jgi:hypothetical protein
VKGRARTAAVRMKARMSVEKALDPIVQERTKALMLAERDRKAIALARREVKLVVTSRVRTLVKAVALDQVIRASKITSGRPKSLLLFNHNPFNVMRPFQ